jgi:hypothetical protein
MFNILCSLEIRIGLNLKNKTTKAQLLSIKGRDRRASRCSGAFNALLDTGSQSGAGYALRACGLALGYG